MHVRSASVLSLLMLVLCGCEYAVPLAKNPAVAIDPNVIGVWSPKQDECGEEEREEKMVILPFSENEYMIIYPAGEEEMYFRAYTVELDGLSVIQLCWLGQRQRPLSKSQKPYQVCKYELNDGILSIQVLNSKVIDRRADTSEALAASLLDKKADPELFQEPARFQKAEEQKREKEN